MLEALTEFLNFRSLVDVLDIRCPVIVESTFEDLRLRQVDGCRQGCRLVSLDSIVNSFLFSKKESVPG